MPVQLPQQDRIGRQLAAILLDFFDWVTMATEVKNAGTET